MSIGKAPGVVINNMHEETFESADRVCLITADAKMAQAILNDACPPAVLKMDDVKISKEGQHMDKMERMQEGGAGKGWRLMQCREVKAGDAS